MSEPYLPGGINPNSNSIQGVVRPQKKTLRRELLETAASTVDGQRDAEYGGPEDSFTMVAHLWSAMKPQNAPYTPEDVALFLAALKLARLSATSGAHSDSWIDLAGYAACGFEVAQRTIKPE